jgi:hypothetical protein
MDDEKPNGKHDIQQPIRRETAMDCDVGACRRRVILWAQLRFVFPPRHARIGGVFVF